jgi:hypothetical protein
MKNTVLGSAVALALWVAAPFAQQQPAPAPKAEPPAHNVFVLTGCLEAGADAASSFKLTDASSIGQAPPAGSAAEAVGTSGRKPSYELRPVSGVNAQGMDADALKAHVGQRVEATVRPIDSPPSPPARGTAGVEPAKPIEPPRVRFSVSAIKRITGTCS